MMAIYAYTWNGVLVFGISMLLHNAIAYVEVKYAYALRKWIQMHFGSE